ncbi:hypothetical protein [Roseivirga sp.]|uniref:hypothetical protein n=1 Tax=Roseivirga sp. TaxID=1964215 RepID=UPI003BAD4154
MNHFYRLPKYLQWTFALAKLNEVKTASTTGDKLVKQKPTILQIQAFLDNRIKTDPS